MFYISVKEIQHTLVLNMDAFVGLCSHTVYSAISVLNCPMLYHSRFRVSGILYIIMQENLFIFMMTLKLGSDGFICSIVYSFML